MKYPPMWPERRHTRFGGYMLLPPVSPPWGYCDLPRPLRLWINVDPQWRLIKLERHDHREGRLFLTLIHVTGEGFAFNGVQEPVASWTPEHVRAAVEAALAAWHRDHGE